MPSTPENGTIRIDADTSGYEASMRSIAASTEQFGRIFSSSLRGAVLSGHDFDDALRSIGQRLSTLALNQAFQPLDSLVGSIFGDLSSSGNNQPASGSANAVSRIANIVFNVRSPDASGFRKSENQISSMLSRAVSRGNRGL